jgi:excisionase family DNA binding protein
MELLTVAETAAYLKVSTVTVRRYIASKRLPCVRVGRNIRVRREDVESLPDAGPEPDIFGPPYFDETDALWSIVGSFESDGPGDVSSNKHKYLAEAYMPRKRK